MAKHKSVLREQAQQINFKSVLPKQTTFKSVLNCQNTFKSVFNLLGLCVEHTFGEKLFQRYIQKSFLVNGDFKKIWNRAKIFFLCALSIDPPFFQSRCLPEGDACRFPSLLTSSGLHHYGITTVYSTIDSREKSRLSPFYYSYSKPLQEVRQKEENLDFSLKSIELETVVCPC